MWQTKYASAVPINLGLGLRIGIWFSAMQWRWFPHQASVVRGTYYIGTKSPFHLLGRNISLIEHEQVNLRILRVRFHLLGRYISLIGQVSRQTRAKCAKWFREWTIHILRKHILAFLYPTPPYKHKYSSERQQNWPFSRPTHPVPCLT